MSDRFTVEMHPELPVMMTKFHSDFVFDEDAMEYSATVKQLLDSQDSPVFYVFDLLEWNLMSFGDLVRAASQAARGENSNFHHPMNRTTLIVTVDKAVGASAEGMTGAAYGNANIKVFNTMDAAMAYVRTQS